MKKQLMSSLDYFIAVSEIQSFAGSRLENAYDSAQGFRLKFKKQGNEFNLVAQPGVRIHQSRFFSSPPKLPSSFTRMLRAELENAVLESVRQVGSDRLVALDFSARGEKRTLVFEQFGKGNALLLDDKGCVIRQLHGVELGGRKLHKGAQYEYPAASSAAEKYAAQMRELEGKTQLEPTVIYEKVLPVAFSFNARTPSEGQQAKAFHSFGEALDEYYKQFAEKEVGESATGALEKQLSKLRRSLEEQHARSKALEQEAADAKRAGEMLYENFELVEVKLAEAKRKNERQVAIELS